MLGTRVLQVKKEKKKKTKLKKRQFQDKVILKLVFYFLKKLVALGEALRTSPPSSNDTSTFPALKELKKNAVYNYFTR